jgi:hypothetical protein
LAQYKCIPIIKVKIGKKQSHIDAGLETIQEYINKHSADGWRWIRNESVNTEYKAGRLSQIPIIKLFVRGDESHVIHYMLFEKV